jgi:hypothetical protein
MAWINMMADMQTQGLPINVAAMMDSLGTQQGAGAGAGVDANGIQAGTASQESTGVTGLLSGLKEKRWTA